jgi:hypothetical protein
MKSMSIMAREGRWFGDEVQRYRSKFVAVFNFDTVEAHEWVWFKFGAMESEVKNGEWMNISTSTIAGLLVAGPAKASWADLSRLEIPSSS